MKNNKNEIIYAYWFRIMVKNKYIYHIFSIIFVIDANLYDILYSMASFFSYLFIFF
jgi:hypothetical protein